MSDFAFSKDRASKIKELKEDIEDLSHKLHSIQTDIQIIDDEFFLKSMAQSISTLDRHTNELKSISVNKTETELIYHILHTPWGAPFVSDVSLLEAANCYVDEKPLLSKLHLILAGFARYGAKFKVQPIESIFILEKTMHTFR